MLLPLSIRSGSTLVLEWIAVHLTRYMSAVQVCSTRAVCLVVPYATIQLCCLEGIPQADTFQRSFATSRPQAFRNGQSLQENLISGTPPSFISFMQGNPSRNSHGTCSKKYRSFEPSFPNVFHSWRLVNESNPASIDVLTCFEAVEIDSRRLIRMSSLPMVYPATSAIICIPNQMFCQICGSQP